MASKRAEMAAERKARAARLERISAGLMAEVAAFNAAIHRGVEVVFPERVGSIASGKRVTRARYGLDGLWVETANYGGSFCLGNDGCWAELLKLAGVERDQRAA